ncbi:MAG: hypothetical protein ABIW80_07490 [Lapillicoccus sp.]
MTAAALVGWTMKYPDVDASKGCSKDRGARSALHRANCPVAVVRPESRDRLSSEPDLRRQATRTDGAE